jgi:hypothetical protein
MSLSKLSYSRQKQIIGECLKVEFGSHTKYKPVEDETYEGWVLPDGTTYLLLKTPPTSKEVLLMIGEISSNLRKKTHLLCFSPITTINEDQKKILPTSTVEAFLSSFFTSPGIETKENA